MNPSSMFVSRVRRWLREVVGAGVDSVCPPCCPGCGVASERLCAVCARLLAWRAAPLCARCGTPVFAVGAPCRAGHRGIQGLQLCRAPFSYRGTGGQLVRRAKFQADRGALQFLARAMGDSLADWARGHGRRALVVSVPLHPGKRRRRGLDQAALLAEQIADRLALGFVPGALLRLRDTLPQGDVRVTSRAANVREAFGVRRPRRVDDRVVVLVDDVRTSGSTACECARVLRAAGARGVVLVTAAQA